MLGIDESQSSPIDTTRRRHSKNANDRSSLKREDEEATIPYPHYFDSGSSAGKSQQSDDGATLSYTELDRVAHSTVATVPVKSTDSANTSQADSQATIKDSREGSVTSKHFVDDATLKYEDSEATIKVPPVHESDGGATQLADDGGATQLADDGGATQLADDGGEATIAVGDGGATQLADDGGATQLADAMEVDDGGATLQAEDGGATQLADAIQVDPDGGATQLADDGGATQFAVEDIDEGPTQLADDGGATQMADDGGATQLAEDGGATQLAEDGGATQLAYDGGATQLADDGGATHLAEDVDATQLADDGGATIAYDEDVHHTDDDNVGFALPRIPTEAGDDDGGATQVGEDEEDVAPLEAGDCVDDGGATQVCEDNGATQVCESDDPVSEALDITVPKPVFPPLPRSSMQLNLPPSLAKAPAASSSAPPVYEPTQVLDGDDERDLMDGTDQTSIASDAYEPTLALENALDVRMDRPNPHAAHLLSPIYARKPTTVLTRSHEGKQEIKQEKKPVPREVNLPPSARARKTNLPPSARTSSSASEGSFTSNVNRYEATLAIEDDDDDAGNAAVNRSELEATLDLGIGNGEEEKEEKEELPPRAVPSAYEATQTYDDEGFDVGGDADGDATQEAEEPPAVSNTYLNHSYQVISIFILYTLL